MNRTIDKSMVEKSATTIFDLISALFTLRGLLYSKFSFGEVYRGKYGLKFSFTATRKRSRKT